MTTAKDLVDFIQEAGFPCWKLTCGSDSFGSYDGSDMREAGEKLKVAYTRLRPGDYVLKCFPKKGTYNPSERMDFEKSSTNAQISNEGNSGSFNGSIMQLEGTIRFQTEMGMMVKDIHTMLKELTKTLDSVHKRLTDGDKENDGMALSDLASTLGSLKELGSNL